MSEEKLSYAGEVIGGRIVTVRGQKGILDADLAKIYGVPTKAMNQTVKRNIEKFPVDFMFQLAPQEVKEMWSQIVTASPRYRSPKYRPFAFVEHGVIMAATVLNSPQAVQMSVLAQREGEKEAANIGVGVGIAIGVERGWV